MDWLISIIIVFGVIGFGIFLAWFLDETDTVEVFFNTILFGLLTIFLILTVIVIHGMIF